MHRGDLIRGYIDDLVMQFVVYDRTSDEDLGRGDIEAAVLSGEISIDDMISRFAEELREALGDLNSSVR